MRFILFVEGFTEKEAVGDFIQRWLNQRLTQDVGVKVVNLKGNSCFEKDILGKVRFHLAPPRGGGVIAAIGLLDLYKGTAYPKDKVSVKDRYEWGVQHYERLVGNAKFRMFFAVHETEAWLLSDPAIFPREVRDLVKKPLRDRPESVNFDKPPAYRLDELYKLAFGRGYKKTTQGKLLFDKLDAEAASGKCPYLKRMLEQMLALAKGAGL
jgi:hypothetical protein